MIYLVSHIRPSRETGHCTFFAQEDFHGEVIIVGCLNVTLFQDEQAATFWAFDVKEPYRNKGIGSRLLETAIEFCRQCGCVTIVLTVFKSNKDAIRLYERFGFVQTGDHGGAWEMTKEL